MQQKNEKTTSEEWAAARPVIEAVKESLTTQFDFDTRLLSSSNRTRDIVVARALYVNIVYGNTSLSFSDLAMLLDKTKPSVYELWQKSQFWYQHYDDFREIAQVVSLLCGYKFTIYGQKTAVSQITDG